MQQGTHLLFKNQPIFRCLLGVKDPRVPGRCLHSLVEVLFVILCALIAGCDGWRSIELFAKNRCRWLKQFITLEHGVPSHFTFARIFSLLDPKQFEVCYRGWVTECVGFIKDELINIDGKTVRNSSHVTDGKKALHLVNAYLPRENMSLGSEKTENKSNEIKAIPVLLNTLQIEGCTITIDAMGTQKGIANLITLKKARYLLALKKNHKRFYQKVDRLFIRSDELNYNAMVYRKRVDSDYGHHRIEERRYTVLPSMYLPRYQKEWKNCQAFVRVESIRYSLEKKVETRACHYYLTSLPFKQYEKICDSIRSHWGIENGLHYKLDVGLREDDSPIYRGYAAENLAVMRKMVLALLQKEKSLSAGIALQRTQAALNSRYLRKVVGL